MNCPHNCTFKSLCVDCGTVIQQIKKNENFSLDWISPGLSVTKEYAVENMYKKENNVLLNRKKLRLVLDLDETLIHCIKIDKPKEDVMDIEGEEEDEEVFVEETRNKLPKTTSFNHGSFQLGDSFFYVYLRPKVEEFIDIVSQFFDIYIYTHGTTKYAHKVLDFLKETMEKQGLNFNVQGISSRNTSHKSEKKLSKMLCQRSTSVIVDDNPNVWNVDDQKNILRVTPFLCQEDDDELEYLLDYLKTLHSLFFEKEKADIRQILKNLSK